MVKTTGHPEGRVKGKKSHEDWSIFGYPRSNPNALPILRIGEESFFVDERLGELRDVKDPSHKESIELWHYYKNKGKFASER